MQRLHAIVLSVYMDAGEAINRIELAVYKGGRHGQTIPLGAALAWAKAMKRSRKKSKEETKPKQLVYSKPKMISGPPDTIRKGEARAQLLGRSFSEHVMRLLEEDYARDEVVVMTVAERSDAYRAFREKHPPLPLPEAQPKSEQSESRKEDDD